jgi:hypothetical protein
MLYASSPLHFLKLTNTNPSRPFAFARLPLSLQLHAPLRSTLLSLLSSSPSSKCLICGVRRWKSDNTFYKSLGKVRKLHGPGMQRWGQPDLFILHIDSPPLPSLARLRTPWVSLRARSLTRQSAECLVTPRRATTSRTWGTSVWLYGSTR